MAQDPRPPQLAPEDMHYVLRLEDQEGALLMVVISDRVEHSGIPCDDNHVKSFALWYSTITGTLPGIDIALLKRAHPQYYWAPWTEVIREMQNFMASADADSILLMSADIINFVPRRELHKPLRSLVSESQLGFFRTLYLLDPLVKKGQTVLSSLWVAASSQGMDCF